MPITPEQCRAARGLLNWSQKELVERSGVSQKAIADFERGVSTPYQRTLKDVIAAFELVGIRFISAEEGVTGQGVALRWGIELPAKQRGELASDTVGGATRSLSLPDDPDLRGLYDYWRERPSEWQDLSDASRRGVLREIFGELPDADPIVDWMEAGENDTSAPL